MTLDSTDWAVLGELQHDGRLSIADLAKRVNLGPTATTDRVRRLEAAGVITGYHARVDLSRVGLPVRAVIRLVYEAKRHDLLRRLLEQRVEILECQRITGEDCYYLKVAAENTAHLEALVDELGGFGHTTTSVIYSETLPFRGPTTTRTIPA
jgi:Lrp/AsnC family transcriptional regulator, leucine-responsive regulatory protein